MPTTINQFAAVLGCSAVVYLMFRGFCVASYEFFGWVILKLDPSRLDDEE
jgi:hypothetical protein